MYRHHLRNVSDVEIIAEFENAEEALLQIPQLKPDSVIVDYTLPGMSGIELAERLNQYPEIKVVLVSGQDQDYINSKVKYPLNLNIVHKEWTERAMARIIAFCR